MIFSTTVLFSVFSTFPVVAQSVSSSQETLKSDPSFVAQPMQANTDGGSNQAEIIEEMVVVGEKRNLMSAQVIKRDANTMVDAVSSEDIGLLPDYSVLDAMQRIPGIALERFANVDDPDHFSTESSGITIRGMSQSRSEFNGRDTFTANQGRALSYQDVPPELMGSIAVYKNQTADMIEGGIGGTVSLETRKPFDVGERVIAFNFDASYGDIAKELSPTYSGLFSDMFLTDIGEFGVLVNYVESKLYGESHGIQSATYIEHYANDLVTENNPGAVGTRAEDFVEDDNLGIVWVPSSANLLMKEDEHERTGAAAVVQFRSPDDQISATFEYIRSHSELTWVEKAMKYNGGYFSIDRRKAKPLDGTHFTFDENGLFEHGVITREELWRVGPTGASRVPQASYGNSDFPQWGHITNMDSRVNDLSSLVEDTSLKLEWQANEKLRLVGDIQYVAAKTANDDVSVHIATWLNTDYDTRGSVPSVRYFDPWLGRRDATRENDDEVGGLDDNIWDEVVDGEPSYPGFGGDPEGDRNYFQDPNSYLWRSAMDHYERSDGDSLALRLDGAYEFDGAIVKSLSAGVRYARRQQVVRSTPYNWGALTPEWQTGTSSDWSEKSAEYVAGEVARIETEEERTLTQWEKRRIELRGNGVGWVSDIESQIDGIAYVDWSDFMGGGVATIPGGQTIHASEDLIRDVMGKTPNRYLRQSQVQSGNWQPYPEREGLDSKYGLFLPEDINTTTEKRKALYLKLDFGGDGELSYSGNVGLRYVTMDREAGGEVVFPGLSPGNRGRRYPPPEELTLPLTPEKVDAYFNQQVANGEYTDYYAAAVNITNVWAENPYYYLPKEIREFGSVQSPDGVYEPIVAVVNDKTDYQTLLPSFNIKVDLTSDLVGRFAFAKAIAFPDMGDVRNRTNFGFVNQADLVVVERTVTVDDREVTLPASVQFPLEEGDLLWVGEGGNPAMKPMESVQYDLSLEWYFSDVGQLSAAVFHKNLSDYFAPGVIYRDFTNPLSQVTQTTAITSKRNGGDAKLDGLELTYHQFFEGMFQGFGVQMTYTYIDANSVPNNVVDIRNEQWYDSIYEDTGIRVNYDKLPLEGQSDHTLNLVGLYEYDAWSAHLSYNWRSKYLLTTRDVTTKAPQWYDDHGELDGSVFYAINDNFTVGMQMVNIANERSETLMILNDDLLSTGRSWFVSDRRIAFVLRGLF